MEAPPGTSQRSRAGRNPANRRGRTMTKQIRALALGLLAVIGLTIGGIRPAEAGSKGKRNMALLLGAVAVYGVAKKKPLIAGLAGGGALYSYTASRRDRDRER